MLSLEQHGEKKRHDNYINYNLIRNSLHIMNFISGARPVFLCHPPFGNELKTIPTVESVRFPFNSWSS